MVTATREAKEVGLAELEPYIMFGASPRASINLILTARALAFVRGRAYALPQDVLDMALDVMRHRLVLSYEALSDNVSADDLLKRVLDRIPIPEVPLHEHVNARVPA
jgi:MoxR-like ATPase